MKLVTTERFRKAFDRLAKEVQEAAKNAYGLWRVNHYHPALHFKQVNKRHHIYSVRVGLSFRALGIKQEETIIWFWVGSHEDYNNLIAQL